VRLHVEGFLLGEGNVFRDRFCATHDFYSAVIEFCSDTGFRLVFAPCDHPDARNENDSRVWIAHSGRVKVLTGLIIRGVVCSVFLQSLCKFTFEGGYILSLRVPIYVEWFYFSTQEVVRTGGT